jgi:hypothetical protein
MIGKLGEAFVYEMFRSKLPGFDASNWESQARNAYGFEGRGNDGLGYDFSYRDEAGMLTGREDAPMCLIEVKATDTDGSGSFPISCGEWREAHNAYNSNDRSYVIIRVQNVFTEPAVFDVILDPVRLWQEGRLQLVNKDLWVRVGIPFASHQ